MSDARDQDDIFRLLNIMTSRFARDPSTRQTSAEWIVFYAVSLLAKVTDTGTAAVCASRAIHENDAADRREKRREKWSEAQQ